METAQKEASLLTHEVLYAYAAEQARRGDYRTANGFSRSSATPGRPTPTYSCS